MRRAERTAYIEAHGRAPARRAADARWLIWPHLEPLIARLAQGAIGWCNASTHALQCMLWVDTGHVFGRTSIERVILRMWRRGRLQHRRCAPGWYFARTRRYTENGTQLNRPPSEADRREQLWRRRNEKRKQRAEARRRAELEHAEQRQRRHATERDRHTMHAAIRSVRKPVDPPRGPALAALLGRKPYEVKPLPRPSELERPKALDLRTEIDRQLAEARALGLFDDDEDEGNDRS